MRMDAEPNEFTVETIETESERLDRLGIYGEIKRELVKRGIPAEEIAFIHDFATPAKKADAFAAANAGRIRVMLASTEKAGTGVNMQERLYALHHLDAPWRPSDVEQCEGRILRPHNRFSEVRIFNYVTENSFDGYMWQTLENKARFISQIMTGEVTARTAEDIDDLVMTAAQVKAIASGNPRILERVSLEVELSRLSRLYTVWRNSRRHLKWEMEALPPRLQELEQRVIAYQQAIALRDDYPVEADESFTMRLRTSWHETNYATVIERGQAYDQLDTLRREIKTSLSTESYLLGHYRGFEILAQRQRQRDEALFTPVEGYLRVPGSAALFPFKYTDNGQATLQSLDAQLRGLDGQLQRALKTQSELQHKDEQLRLEWAKGWEYAPKYTQLQAELIRVNQALRADGSEINETMPFAVLEEEALRVCPPPCESHLTQPTEPAVTSLSPEMPAVPTMQATPLVKEPAIMVEPAPSVSGSNVDALRDELLRQRRSTAKRKAATATAPTAQMSLW
ncbi:MAG TPA: hypothetical protein PLD20_16730 [Blastocatellia bacterium]|nr:hypothetical protein [Blastocatellia bacterium]HMY73642.1 hypothetical protein [Blastocatellia bacterium]HMZ19584.1 hypothetical protein [Blastocatellia bacterium]